MPSAHFETSDINWSAFKHPKLQAVRVLVHKHISDENGPTLVATANFVGLSPKYFSAFFRQHVGVTFSFWRGYIKIEQAKVLFLESPWRPVGAIAMAVGYQDLTTFGRAFKRYEAICPRQYREIASDLAGWHHGNRLRDRRKLMHRIT